MTFIKIITTFSIVLGLLSACFLWSPNGNHAESRLNTPVNIPLNKQIELSLPKFAEGLPRAGKKVSIISPEYQGTQVYHTVYLPDDWSAEKLKQGQTWPVIFEYTGNKYPKSGSSGEVKDAAFGYGLSAGKYIWVSLPYISKNKTENQLTWWGDKEATVNYAKLNVPRILKAFAGDPSAVFLCGFSRGSIAVNYLGLHDDEIASLWSAFIVHDHFDGEQEWTGTSWGAPLEKYQKEAAIRLKRVNGRPYLVTSVQAHSKSTQEFVDQRLSNVDNFSYITVNTKQVFGKFPHPLAKGGHTDSWPLLPSEYRSRVWQWMNESLPVKAK